jgi:hypothetical protein
VPSIEPTFVTMWQVDAPDLCVMVAVNPPISTVLELRATTLGGVDI